MKIITGLGNPGKKHKKTRHNFGFMLLDRMSVAYGFNFIHSDKFLGEWAEVNSHGERLLFLKPHTYMNLSGASVLSMLQFYKQGIEDLLVIYDDVDLPLGKIRFMSSGGSGGHKGVQSIMDTLGRSDFVRFKLGIGRPKEPDHDVSDFVLQNFIETEKSQVNDVLDRGVSAVQVYLLDGLDKAMNLYN